MSEGTQTPPVAPAATAAAAPARPSILQIFVVFLVIGATSFGGGVVAYLRNALVRDKKWIDDVAFLELMGLSNSLPGLNATNMSILAGDRLAGLPGAIAALLGMCIPGFIFMTAAGFVYAQNHTRPLVEAALRGVAAAAVGLLAATWVQIGKKTVKGGIEAAFILVAVLGVNRFGFSVPEVLIVVTAVAIYVYRPKPPETPAVQEDEWISSLR